VTEISFDPSESFFIEGSRESDIDSESLENLLKQLQFKTQWAYDKKYADGVEGGFTNHYASMAATVDVSLSGETEAPKAEEDL
jgi:hypothetical protein